MASIYFDVLRSTFAIISYNIRFTSYNKDGQAPTEGLWSCGRTFFKTVLSSPFLIFIILQTKFGVSNWSTSETYLLPNALATDTTFSLLCWSPETLRFNYDSNRLRETDTPKMLEMEEGDCIDAYVEMVRGWTLFRLAVDAEKWRRKEVWESKYQ